MRKEFKKFLSQGDAMDMAIGVVIGAAFSNIINTLVSGLLTPLLTPLTKGVNFKDFVVSVGIVELQIGAVIDALLQFVIIGFVMFLVVKSLNKIKYPHGEPKVEVTTKICPYCKSEIDKDATRCPHCTSELEEGKN